ncbi:septum site-determining protein MinC [uncultured Eubacterium sp.]|uniref:septum site-determining protein MinC n=1 Tax=uncultured Eubacterium sp. TaxID=165185 RepID=UPI0025ECEE68|nr:septum site-determining protein MinC [uncultured Eubacterium sp.]
MSQAVVIKSNKYGINLILDKNMPFQELLVAIKEKFQESEKFFKDAKMAISFEGRALTQEEEYQIIETITENTSISIICIVDNDESHADMVKQQIDAYYDSVAGREGEFYRGTLRSGQVLESVSSVVIVGDVNPGAKIISQGNIVVLGALKGNAYAGAAGDSNCFIVALEMDPIQIQIGDILAKSPDNKKMKPRRLRRKEKNPVSAEAQIAVAKGGNIYIEPITRGSLMDYTK